METLNTPTTAKPLITRAKIKRYALKVSKERRAGKFTRFSSSFLDAVETDVDSAIRQLAVGDFSEVTPCDEAGLITGEALNKAKLRLDMLARLITFRKVMRHPTLGITLSA